MNPEPIESPTPKASRQSAWARLRAARREATPEPPVLSAPSPGPAPPQARPAPPRDLSPLAWWRRRQQTRRLEAERERLRREAEARMVEWVGSLEEQVREAASRRALLNNAPVELSPLTPEELQAWERFTPALAPQPELTEAQPRPSEQIDARIGLRSLAMFTRQLAILYRSGVPLLRAVGSLGSQQEDVNLAQILIELRRDLLEGRTLSSAMSRRPKAFPPYYVSMVKAAEVASTLDTILERLADSLEAQYRLRQQVRAALSYPAFVFLVAALMNLGVFRWILPRFEPVFADSGTELPLVTALLMQAVRWSGAPWFWLLVLLGAGGLAWLWFNASRYPRLREAIDHGLLKLPLVGAVYRRVLLVQTFSVLQNLFHAGVPIQRSFQLVGGICQNLLYERALNGIAEEVIKGQTMTSSFEAYPEEFSGLVVHMVYVGETVGDPATSFQFLTSFYQVELDTILEDLARLIEPLMVGVLGLITGAIVLAVFLPIYKIVTNLL